MNVEEGIKTMWRRLLYIYIKKRICVQTKTEYKNLFR